jgi:hypothetical protein
MPITTWIRDLLGIPREVIDLKKSKLELEKLEDEKRQRTITIATLKDIKEYDPRVEAIKQNERRRLRNERRDVREYHGGGCALLWIPAWFSLLLLVIVVVMVVIWIIWFLR